MAAPAEWFCAKGPCKVVSSDPAVAPVAVAERVDGNETVVESHGDFIYGIRICIDPTFDVVNERAHSDGDLDGLDTDVRLALPVLPSPIPDLSEHRPVQVSEIIVVKKFLCLWSATEQGLGDVALLGFEQFASGRDIARDQSFVVFRRQFSVAVSYRQEGVVHDELVGSAQRPRRLAS